MTPPFPTRGCQSGLCSRLPLPRPFRGCTVGTAESQLGGKPARPPKAPKAPLAGKLINR